MIVSKLCSLLECWCVGGLQVRNLLGVHARTHARTPSFFPEEFSGTGVGEGSEGSELRAGAPRPEPMLPQLPPLSHPSLFPPFAVTPPSGDQSTPATWSRELQDSRTAEPCQSSTRWRATWRRGDERPLLSSPRTKASAPSPHSHGTFPHSRLLF